jgi:hypothetical protein
MTLFREHRGSVSESMETLFEFDSIMDFSRHIGHIRPDLVIRGSVVGAKYYCGLDSRIGWKETYIVTAEPGGVIGFIDGPLPERRFP